MPQEFETAETAHDTNSKKRWPKTVGIVFVEELNRDDEFKLHLNFDQIACSHFLLQMNSVQRIFDFRIIVHAQGFPAFKIPTIDHDIDLFVWLDEEISKFEASKEGMNYQIDYWIGITSEDLGRNRFVQGMGKFEGISGKPLWLITSSDWQEVHSPPSLFEYLAITTFMCSLSSLSQEFNCSLYFHLPYMSKGCIFDFTKIKEHRRIIVSNPNLCVICEDRLVSLQKLIKDGTNTERDIVSEVKCFLKREWMGNSNKVNSPIYNLKKNYGYDVDRNSGFYKKPWEKFRDSIKDKSAEWIVGGIFTLIFGLIAAFVTGILHLNP